MKTVQTVLIDDEPVLIEIEGNSDDSGTEQLGLKDIKENIVSSFDDTMENAHRFAKGIVRKIKKFDKSITPNTFELQFGVKFGAKGGVITEASGEAQLIITLTYQHSTTTKTRRGGNERKQK